MERTGGSSRVLYFILGVLLASTIGLAITLGLTLDLKDDDDKDCNNVVVTQGQGMQAPMTQQPQAPMTQAPAAGKKL